MWSGSTGTTFEIRFTSMAFRFMPQSHAEICAQFVFLSYSSGCEIDAFSLPCALSTSGLKLLHVLSLSFVFKTCFQGRIWYQSFILK